MVVLSCMNYRQQARSVPDMSNDEKLIQRFFGYVDFQDCWLWIGGKVQGYGRFNVYGEIYYAHRVSYELFNNPVAKPELVIDHLCRNPSCVNPSHLELVTQTHNVLRGVGNGAKNKQKTECKRGHPFSETNTYIDGRGDRNCKKCKAVLLSKYRHQSRVNIRTD